jgi:aldehyde dehydrogenase (NAD+)
MNNILKKLNIEAVNSGVCYGPQGWLKDDNAETVTSYNPTTGEALASVQMATSAHYETIVEKSQVAFLKWRDTPAPQRGEVVRQIGEALREYKEPLGDLVTLEVGKIRAEGHGEVQEMIDVCDFAVGLSRQLYGLTMASERPHHRMYEQWHPIGVTGVITAFNFPVAVWAWNAALAAVCGDPCIWKPSPLAPLTAVATQHIVNKVAADFGLDGVFNLALGGKELGETMINDKRLPLISFTGSIPVGRHVAQTVAGRLGKSILELGGNNAIIVENDADLDMTTRAVLFGAVGTTGQRCTSTRRLIVHKDVVEPLTQSLVKDYQQVPIGNPLDDGTLMGPLITEDAVNNYFSAIETAKAAGGEVLTGGERREDLGAQFITPTIIKMPSQLDIVCEETFAPILYVMAYETLDEAIEIHNAVTQGLSSAIFTDSVRKAEQFLSTLGSDCGIANVNIGTSGAEIGGAFGGEKDTGGGRESGSDSWKAYMRRQTNTINWSKELPLAQGIKFGDE